MNGYNLVRHQKEQDTTIDARVKKTGDSMTGDLNMTNNAKLIGNVQGNATTATTATKVGNSLILNVGGFPASFNGQSQVEVHVAPNVHNHGSDIINQMTGYTKGNISSAITASDTLNSAIGKLENKVDGKANSSHTHNYAGSNTSGGSANSAVKLQTARTINGVSFDGTKNITVADNTKLPLTGGTLTGDLKIAKSNAQLTLNGKDANYYQIAHSSANNTLVFSYNTTGLFTVQNNGSIIPIKNKMMSIGDYNYRISDLYVGNNTGDKEYGYTTLSNGYTLMWGSNVIPSYPVSTTVAETQITFPLVTKDQCFPMVSSYDIDGKLLTVRNLDAKGFKVVVRNLYHDTPTWNHRINWYCLVKL